MFAYLLSEVPQLLRFCRTVQPFLSQKCLGKESNPFSSLYSLKRFLALGCIHPALWRKIIRLLLAHGNRLHGTTGENMSEWEVALTSVRHVWGVRGHAVGSCVWEKVAMFVSCVAFFLIWLCPCRGNN